MPFLRLTKDDTRKPVLVNMDLVLDVLEHGASGSVLSLTNGATMTVSESLDDIARLLASPPPPRPFGTTQTGAERVQRPRTESENDDSPKRQGDKLENAREAAAGRRKKITCPRLGRHPRRSANSV